MLVKKVEVIPVECIVRGYLAGSGWKEYKEHGTVCKINLPDNLKESDKLPEPIFTPSTKAESSACLLSGGMMSWSSGGTMMTSGSSEPSSFLSLMVSGFSGSHLCQQIQQCLLFRTSGRMNAPPRQIPGLVGHGRAETPDIGSRTSLFKTCRLHKRHKCGGCAR